MENSIATILREIPDPRVAGRCLHLLEDILFISLCCVIAGGEDFEDMVVFGNEKHKWLLQYITLPNGIPSHDTFNRLFQLIDNELFSECLGKHGKTLLESITGKQVCLDGKKIRGVSPSSRGNKGLYTLNAWVAENRICIGQRKVEDKSNEITAIVPLLESLDITGSTVSTDAMGTQKEVATTIIDCGADYFLALKKNQGSLFEEVEELFTAAKGVEVLCSEVQWEYDHGRYETRKCSIISAEKELDPDVRREWKELKTLVRIDAQRTIKAVTTNEIRYYIASGKTSNPLYYNGLGRGHWGIENHLHWHLDVTFKEDASRARTGNAPLNLAVLRKTALQLIAQRTEKISFKKRRYRAALNDEYLEDILNI
jgi:predicted transposase YbfD/YdcC